MAQEGASHEQIKAFSNYQSELFKIRKAEAVRIAKEKGWVIKKSIPGGGLIEIMNIGPNGVPKYNITDNVDAAITSGTNELWADSSSGLDLDGAGFLIGEWDGGRVRQYHQEFTISGSSRVTLNDGLIDLSDHSTHVAGTLIAEGQVSAAHGMAPAALLHSYDWNDDIGEMADAYADDDLILSNHSYGLICGWYENEEHIWYWYGDVEISQTEDYEFGFYGDLAKSWDSLAYLCPYYLIVKAAGNERDDSYSGDHLVFHDGNWVPSNATRDPDGGTDGYDCIGDRAVAKNLFTIGAVADIPGGYTAPVDVVMTSFSSWGPTDDGRIKPDIVASGSYLYSCLSTSTSAYGPMSGTSMAAPTACGTIALLQDYYHSLHNSYMLSSTVKALVINTAYECGTTAGPEYSYGWGLLNSVGAAELITEDQIEGDLINVNFLFNTETETYTYFSTGSTAINVTICWTDPPGTPVAPALNPENPMLVHDLDLRIIRTSGSTYYPWILNPDYPSLQAAKSDNFRDNVEKITISNPPPGEYTIRVTHKGTISGQQYAMVISGLTSSRPTNTWTGNLGTSWTASSNWSLNHEPASSENVVIPAGCTNYPILTNDLGIGYYSVYTHLCHNLTIASDAIMTLNGRDLYSAGTMNIDGILYIGDDLILNNGNLTNLLSNGSIYTGYSDGYHGYLLLNSGSSVIQSGGNFFVEELLLYEGSQYNASAGYFHMYKHGTANSNQLVQINDADNHFYYFFIDTLTQVYLDNCSEDLNVNYFARVSGTLALNSFKMNANLMNVFGELIITTGMLNITQTGPIFYNTSMLNMVGGELISNNSIWFNSGSNVNFTDGTMSIRRDLYNQFGKFTPSGGKVRFFGNPSSEIKGATTFFQLEIEKSPGITVLSANNVHVTNTLNILSGELLIQNSTLHIGAGN